MAWAGKIGSAGASLGDKTLGWSYLVRLVWNAGVKVMRLSRRSLIGGGRKVVGVVGGFGLCAWWSRTRVLGARPFNPPEELSYTHSKCSHCEEGPRFCW